MQGGAEGGVKRSKKRRGGKKRKRRGGRGGKGHRVGPLRRRPKGYCVCPACGAKVAIYTEVPCYIMNCAKCGSTMVKQTANTKHPQGIPRE
jgi:Zn ribbon nucleic-acid-binding protein